MLAWVLVVRAVAAHVGSDGQRADAILTRWVDAIGGASEIAQLKSADYHCEISFGPGTTPIDTYIQATSAGLYRYEYKLPAFGLLVQAFNGRFAWQENDRLGFGVLSNSDHTQNLAGIDFRAPIRVGSDFPERKLLPDETIDGRRLQVLELADRLGMKGKWYFEPATGLRVRIEVDNSAGPMVAEYSDFRTVHGLQEPFHSTHRGGGARIEVTMRSILYNAGEEPELFAPPASALEDFNRVERVFRKYDEVTGIAALRRVRTRVTRETIEITTSNLKIPATIFQKRPNLMVMEQDVPGMGKSWEGYDGQTGWAWSELQGYRVMKGAELQQMLGSADLDGPLRLGAACPLRRLLDEKEENGRRLMEVGLASVQGPAGNFYFDTETGNLVRAETFVQAGANGQLKVVADFADFRTVDGVMIPFVTTLTNPAIRTVMRIESVRQNVPLDDAIFRPRKGE